MVSWKMGTLNPWGWGGPRTQCPGSWVSALILGLLQEQRALALLPPPLPAAFKRRKQLRLHSWRVWSCEWEVGVFPEFLQDWVPQGTLVPPCLAMWDLSGAAQAKPGTWGTEAPPGWDRRTRGLGDWHFFGCWNFPKSFLGEKNSDVISKHWGPLRKAASMEPFNGHPEFPFRVMLLPSLTIKRRYRGALMQVLVA